MLWAMAFLKRSRSCKRITDTDLNNNLAGPGGSLAAQMIRMFIVLHQMALPCESGGSLVAVLCLLQPTSKVSLSLTLSLSLFFLSLSLYVGWTLLTAATRLTPGTDICSSSWVLVLNPPFLCMILWRARSQGLRVDDGGALSSSTGLLGNKSMQNTTQRKEPGKEERAIRCMWQPDSNSAHPCKTLFFSADKNRYMFSRGTLICTCAWVLGRRHSAL